MAPQNLCLQGAEGRESGPRGTGRPTVAPAGQEQLVLSSPDGFGQGGMHGEPHQAWGHSGQLVSGAVFGRVCGPGSLAGLPKEEG